MKPQVFIAIALTLGALAAFFVARQMSDNQASGEKVVIVMKPVKAGKAIKSEQISAIEWSGPVVPQNAFTRTKDVTGRVTRVNLIPGEPVLPGKLAPVGSKGGLSSVIPKGKRAITVRVNEVIAVAGFALPGSYVDILLNGRDIAGKKFTRTVLSRVKVLAVDQVTSENPDKPKVVNAVTLELTPQESEKLDLARNIGKLSLVLRNELDTLKINSEGVRIPDIVYPNAGRKTTVTAPAAALPRSSRPIEIRGIKVSNP